MSASSLPRSLGVRSGAAALTAFALAGTALLGAPAAFAAPGDNGDVKIHAETTSPTDQRNEPKVCKFYLAAFNFDDVQGITWTIEPQPAASASATLNGTLTLPIGTGYTDTLALPDGQYKLTWKIMGGNGAGKSKVFKVDCKPTAPTKPPATPPAPNGGVPAGGGGLAEAPTVSAVAAAGAVGLVGVSGFVYFRMLRRRPDGAA
ncbi:hypothetical protein O1Q96_29655 [Streptomyces sp. Qhu-G9]|uniref:hypothetical protein n=1 Tax=Streptomyces sp. Qhu-G9 TaxID=3452799 RepID=UPI0022AC500E|nr:hypothetical protein [Streptomyces aurantiacus]WAU83493.1 hypothetical protein O1Q96_29655 [Streptomyces aurantiacus]